MRQTQQPTIFDQLNRFYTVFNDCSRDSCQSCACDGFSISEDEERFYIDALLPGVKSEEINVALDPQTKVLSICGAGKQKYHYNYEIPLSNDISFDNPIDAVSRDGILSITLSKNRGHKPLKIDVKSS